MGAQVCMVCGLALPESRRSNRRYCNGLCRVRAFRIRAGVGIRERHLHREYRDTAAKVAGGAAAALAVVALKRKLDQERAERQTQEARAAKLHDQLTRAHAVRDAVIQEAEQLRHTAQLRQQQHHIALGQNQTREAIIQQLSEDLSRTQKSLALMTWDFKELHAEWNGAENRCTQMRRQIEAYGAARNEALSLSPSGDRRTQHQLEMAREQNQKLRQQVRQFKGMMTMAERQHARLEASSKREAALAAHVDGLQKQLEGVQSQEAWLQGKVKRLKKKNARLLVHAEAENSPRPILGGVVAALSLGAGAVVVNQASKQLQLKRARKPALLPAGRPEPPPPSTTRALSRKSER